MRPGRSVICAAILLAATSLASTGAEAQVYTGPKCLGPVCIDRNASSEELVQRLGGPSSAGGIYGYRDKNADAFLIITDAGKGKLGLISLRDFGDYGAWTKKDGKLAAQDIRNWKTPEGVGLGSSEADILNAYGKPSGVEALALEDSSRQRGKRLLIYKGRLNGATGTARFRLRVGRVSFIELENDAFVGPDCLGPYCTYGDLTFDNLLHGLGLPPQKNRPSPLVCFQSQDGQTFLHFNTDVEETYGVADFLLSDFPNCLRTSKRVTQSRLGAWKTPEGIGLGSSEEDVVSAYGVPSAEKKLEAQKPIPEIKGLIDGYRGRYEQVRPADKIIVYGPRELQTVDFGIRDGRVSYIWLKDSDFWLKDDQ